MAVVGPDVLCGRYELRGVIGRGGMGEVRDGWDSRLERPIAVKLLHSSFASAPHLVERFHLEARAAAGLSHPNVVSVYDFGEHRGVPFIVMERLPGQTLADQVARRPLPQQHVRRVLDRVLAALEAAHMRQILHRDIKPGNILVTEGGDVKVADFGLAKTPHTANTQTGQIMGTMAYISPERLAGAPASVADDLYATAVLGYECLAGRRPFAGGDNLAVLAQAILNDRPPPLYTMRPDVEPQLAAVIERGLARDPQSRFATANQMRAALYDAAPASIRPATKVLAAPPFTAVPGSLAMMPAPTRATGGRTGKLLVTLAALVVLAVVAVAFASDPPTSGTPQPVGTGATDSPPPAAATPVVQPPPQPAPEAGPGEDPPSGKGGGPRKGSKHHDG